MGVKCVDLGPTALEKELVGESAVAPAVRYLRSYLATLNAASMLVESHYVDRHHLDDFVQYYARSFNTPPPYCSRLHFFSDLKGGDLRQLVERAYRADSRAAVEAELAEKYLGFVVRRPLHGSPIGRTVLRTYPADSGRRHYTVLRRYHVNVAGLRLAIDGLAYQQQDAGAAVCASTALWSALQKVAQMAGHRTPTPSEVTRAAESPFAPAAGLQPPQMATALARLGYLADAFAPADNRALFRARLVACLQSQLPVVLLITQKRPRNDGVALSAHAVTVTGFSEPQQVISVPWDLGGTDPMPMKSASVETIYVHDDNLGSHAHYELEDSDERDERGNRRLLLRRGRKSGEAIDGWPVDDLWAVELALVPKPSKLRMPVEQLVRRLEVLRQLFVGTNLPGEVYYEAHFTTGVQYRDTLFDVGFNRQELASFQANVDLPRHVGILTLHNVKGPQFDIVTDVTEVERPDFARLWLGIVGRKLPMMSALAKNLRSIVAGAKVQTIFAP